MKYEPFALSMSKGYDELTPNGNCRIIGPDQSMKYVPFALSLSKGFDQLNPTGN